MPEVDFLDFRDSDRLIAASAELPGQLERDHFSVADGDWGRMILLGLRTGMRIGELLALRCPHVRLRAGKVHVCEATTRKVVGTPKSGKARDIPLSSQAIRALREHKHKRSSLVFCDTEGQPLSRDQCVKPLALAAEHAGLRHIPPSTPGCATSCGTRSGIRSRAIW